MDLFFMEEWHFLCNNVSFSPTRVLIVIDIINREEKQHLSFGSKNESCYKLSKCECLLNFSGCFILIIRSKIIRLSSLDQAIWSRHLWLSADMSCNFKKREHFIQLHKIKPNSGKCPEWRLFSGHVNFCHSTVMQKSKYTEMFWESVIRADILQMKEFLMLTVRDLETVILNKYK